MDVLYNIVKMKCSYEKSLNTTLLLIFNHHINNVPVNQKYGENLDVCS